MAYNRRNYNPDALPAHAEPEQAAQMLSRNDSTSRQDTSSKAAPPAPVQTYRPSGNDDRYNRTSPPAAAASAYKSPTSRTGGYNDWDRRPPPQAQPPHISPRQYSEYDSRGPRQDHYGSRQPPPGAYDHPPPRGRPSPTPAPPRDGNDRDALWPMFKAVDKDRSGQLEEQELGAALVNGDYTSFDPYTVRMMIRMFDVDRSGTISFDEFCGLWGFLSEWRKLFDRFDADQSGNISYDEFTNALVAFGYRLSPEYVSQLFASYDSKGRGVLSFDLFVQSCISLKRMTDVFKKYDTDRDGYITLSFEEFLTGAQSLFI